MQIACYVRCDATFQRVQTVLAHAGFDAIRFLSETALLRTLGRQSFSLIMVDTNDNADEDEAIYSWLNCRTGESTPVVLLSSAHNPGKAARALDAGADEYIHQPFHPGELIARLHAVLRRTSKKSPHRVIDVLGFSLDQDSSRLLDRGVPVDLTPREFTMAWLFFSSPGTYMSRTTISTAIWGVDCDIAARTIEQHIYKLRKKLNLCAERGVAIRTAYTKGYCLQLNENVPEDLARQALPAPVTAAAMADAVKAGATVKSVAQREPVAAY